MVDHPIFVFMAVLILGYGIISKRAEQSIITAPMVFVLVGLLVSFLPVEILQEGPKAGLVKVLAELTLILVLFIDASTIDREKLKLDRSLPIRLLGWSSSYHASGSGDCHSFIPRRESMDTYPDGLHPFSYGCGPRPGRCNRAASTPAHSANH